MSDTYATITRTIQAAIENPTKEDLVGTVLDPNGGTIKLPIQLINWRGRDLLALVEDSFDPEDFTDKIPTEYFNQCMVDNFDVSNIPSYQKYGTVYLNRIQVAVNGVIDAIENYNTGTHPNKSQARKFLQTAFSYFEDTVLDTLVGKNGLICKNVIGMRINYSMMTPAAGTHSCNHDEVLIPFSEAQTIHAKSGHIIMAHREPLLHGPGIVFLKALVVPDSVADSTRLPWAVFKGMNADCDGDLVFLTNLSPYLTHCDPKDKEKILDEINRATNTDIQNHSYDASLRLLNMEARPAYKDNSCTEDLLERLEDSHGLSFGLDDIYGDKDSNPFLTILKEQLDIDPERILKYSRPLAKEEWSKDIQETCKALCYTKRGLGLVGAIGNYCLVLSSYYPRMIRGAVAIKQGLSQTVLDAKHGEDLDHINECLNALMKTGPFEDATIFTRIAALVKNGFDETDMVSIFAVLGDDGIITKVYRDFPGFLMTTGQSNLHSLFARFVDGQPDKSGPGTDAGAWWDNCVMNGAANANADGEGSKPLDCSLGDTGSRVHED